MLAVEEKYLVEVKDIMELWEKGKCETERNQHVFQEPEGVLLKADSLK